MAKRGLKLFGMGVGTLVVLAAIVVGILFATGVIKFKQDDGRKPDPVDPADPAGKSTDMIDAGTVTISDVKVISGTCHGDDPCTAAGISYHLSSTCKGTTDCSMVVTHKFIYANGAQDIVTETYRGTGGTYQHRFTNSWMGQTRIPIGVDLTAHSVVNGIKGKESGNTTIRISN